MKGEPLEGYPIDTSRFWDQLPVKLDAAYERIDDKILFFKGKICFVLRIAWGKGRESRPPHRALSPFPPT